VGDFDFSRPAIRQNRETRFAKYLNLASAGTLFNRPTENKNPLGKAHFYYEDPVFDRLQGSYDDVREELRAFRRSPHHRGSMITFLGLDGLSCMRVNHLLRNEPDEFLYTSPACIPLQGMYPHGCAHVAHAGWRLWQPFVKVLTTPLASPAVREDWEVKEFNQHEVAILIQMRACAEYLAELLEGEGIELEEDTRSLWGRFKNSKGESDTSNLMWIAQALDNYYFPYWQLMNEAIRSGDTDLVDLL
jgi:hypothetical protein